ncbi:MAG: hypothetical protein ACFWUC_13110 [Oscillospiraceae bacterium]
MRDLGYLSFLHVFKTIHVIGAPTDFSMLYEITNFIVLYLTLPPFIMKLVSQLKSKIEDSADAAVDGGTDSRENMNAE